MYRLENIPTPNVYQNRNQYFKKLLQRQEIGKTVLDDYYMLNVGSGTCHDLLEYFDDTPGSSIKVDCVDMEVNAISYAKAICRKHLHRLHFEYQDIFKFTPSMHYDLIWSASLFDQLADKQYVHLLRQLSDCLVPGGRMVIANISANDYLRPYVKLVGERMLKQRSETKLLDLGTRAVDSPKEIYVEAEPGGFNLFLHIVKR